LGDYTQYYEEATINGSKNAPWYIVPADDKEMARYVAKIIWEEMQNILILRNRNR
jgi:polyphosphate kinase 2 (PPK2 family)